ncbi:uncharacterized protein LOC124389154 [Silurus meridionalis]|uniref:uncharacterized protein LOC124389154 n=1 Tax=Silurus meridionalis TaxID=175797 RepID=UPI001EEB5A4B|nr:uncharacterized protein LOC124389154 [Silurus meridionalis]
MQSVGIPAVSVLIYLLMLPCQAFIIREVLVKDSVTFPCSCTGNCPVVQWSRFIPSYTIVAKWKCPRGQNLQKRFEISGDTSRGDFSLMIISVAYNDGGSYRCSCNGETVSEVKMKVLVATVVKVQEKQNVTLPCYGDTRRQDVKDVQWKKDGGKVVLYTHANRSVTTDEAGSRFMMSVEDFLDGDLSLHISSVHLSDAGEYRCLLHDESQDGEPSTVVLEVEGLQHQTTTSTTSTSSSEVTVLRVLLGLISVGFIIGLMVWIVRRHRDHPVLDPEPQAALNPFQN